MVKRRVSERRLVDVLVSFFRKTHVVGREVPHYEKRIDLAMIDQHSREVVAIEAKVKDWPRAIGQARVNLAVADKSYVAIFSENAHRVDRDALARAGVGLIAVGTKWGDVTVLLPAAPSPYPNRIAADRLVTRITAKVS